MKARIPLRPLHRARQQLSPRLQQRYHAASKDPSLVNMLGIVAEEEGTARDFARSALDGYHKHGTKTMHKVLAEGQRHKLSQAIRDAAGRMEKMERISDIARGRRAPSFEELTTRPEFEPFPESSRPESPRRESLSANRARRLPSRRAVATPGFDRRMAAWLEMEDRPTRQTRPVAGARQEQSLRMRNLLARREDLAAHKVRDLLARREDLTQRNVPMAEKHDKPAQQSQQQAQASPATRKARDGSMLPPKIDDKTDKGDRPQASMGELCRKGNMRGWDPQGSGSYLANRRRKDGTVYEHQGADCKVKPGTLVLSHYDAVYMRDVNIGTKGAKGAALLFEKDGEVHKAMTGYMELTPEIKKQIAKAKNSGDPSDSYKTIEKGNEHSYYKVDIKRGDPIGIAQDVRDFYSGKGMTPHLHAEIWKGRTTKNPKTGRTMWHQEKHVDPLPYYR
ncbi:MAG: hypothetical protein AAF442_03955 [Pseudomonadota bacterium]